MSETTTFAPVKVGTIFDSSWGYDQTNIDFYEVVRISKSGKMVTVQKIGQTVQSLSENAGHETVVPDRTRKIGEPFRRKLHHSPYSGAGISVTSYAWASQWEGSPRSQTAAGWGH